MGEQKQRRYVTPHRQSRALDSRVLAGSRCMDGQETAGANDAGYHARATGRSVCTSRACQPPGHLWIYRSARLSSPPPAIPGVTRSAFFAGSTCAIESRSTSVPFIKWPEAVQEVKVAEDSALGYFESRRRSQGVRTRSHLSTVRSTADFNPVGLSLFATRRV